MQASWPISRWAKRVAIQRRNGCDGIIIYRLAEFDPAVAAFIGNSRCLSSATFPEPKVTGVKGRP